MISKNIFSQNKRAVAALLFLAFCTALFAFAPAALAAETGVFVRPPAHTGENARKLKERKTRPAKEESGREKATIADVRFGKKDGRERIVLELAEAVENIAYKETIERDGTRLVIKLPDVRRRNGATPVIKGDFVKQISFRRTARNFFVIIDLHQAAAHKIRVLKGPSRLVIDFRPFEETKEDGQIAPGLVRTDIVRHLRSGKIRAYLLTVDPKYYALKPALALGVVNGCTTTSRIARDNGAIAAINASYFDPDGTILGLLRINGTIVGKTELKRTAIGFYPDGRAHIGSLEYDGRVAIGDAAYPVYGVNAPRGEDALIIYNHLFGRSTKTNEYGRELVVKGGKIIAVQPQNSPLKADGSVIVSLHGGAAETFAAAKSGDAVEIAENLGEPWREIPDIIGAGPLLVYKGRVRVTKAAEKFPGDIAVGRAPRTAVGIKKDGSFLLLVVDGRQRDSVGMTLEELAALLVRLGAESAINFDGGGSSAMVIKNQLVNSPSDGQERRVGSAFVVVKR